MLLYVARDAALGLSGWASSSADHASARSRCSLRPASSGRRAAVSSLKSKEPERRKNQSERRRNQEKAKGDFSDPSLFLTFLLFLSRFLRSSATSTTPTTTKNLGFWRSWKRFHARPIDWPIYLSFVGNRSSSVWVSRSSSSDLLEAARWCTFSFPNYYFLFLFLSLIISTFFFSPCTPVDLLF